MINWPQIVKNPWIVFIILCAVLLIGFYLGIIFPVDRAS